MLHATGYGCAAAWDRQLGMMDGQRVSGQRIGWPATESNCNGVLCLGQVGWLAKLLTLDTVDEIKGMSEDMWMSLANMTVAIRGSVFGPSCVLC